MMTCLTVKIWVKWISERDIPAQENEYIYKKRVSSRNFCNKWKKWSHHLSMNLSQSFKGETEKLVDGGRWIFRESSLSGIK